MKKIIGFIIYVWNKIVNLLKKKDMKYIKTVNEFFNDMKSKANHIKSTTGSSNPKVSISEVSDPYFQLAFFYEIADLVIQQKQTLENQQTIISSLQKEIEDLKKENKL